VCCQFPVSRNFCALSLVECLAREGALHRVPVIDRESKQMVALLRACRRVFPHLTFGCCLQYNLVTQATVSDFLLHQLDAIGTIADKPLSQCGSMLKNVVAVSEEASAIQAYEALLAHKVSGVCVLDKESRLVGTLALRDLKLMCFDPKLFARLHGSGTSSSVCCVVSQSALLTHVQNLVACSIPVASFLARLRAEHQAKKSAPLTLSFALPTTTLGAAIALLAEHKVQCNAAPQEPVCGTNVQIHRIFIVDDAKTKRVIGEQHDAPFRFVIQACRCCRRV
jgi:hypothetical protein